MEELEDFTDLPDYPGHEISTTGMIQNRVTGKYLRQSNSYGCKLVTLAGRRIRVHRLVAVTFLHNPLNASTN